tara:strand:- start:81 stop:638 length:558 start_codon:yes stop_codon:yes gene_type:complete
MNGAENIKNKILEEAKKEADKISAEAKVEEEKILSNNKKEEESYTKKREDEIEKEVKLFKDKTLAQARLKSKRAYLAERETIIEKYVKEGIKSIGPTSKDYQEYIKKILTKNIKLLSGEITVFCNKKDEPLIKKLIGDKAKVVTARLTGGVTLEDSSGIKIDESIDSKVERVKDKLRQKIVKAIE